MAECRKHGRTYLMGGVCAKIVDEAGGLCGWKVPPDSDEARGIYKKYSVTRCNDEAGKHRDCEYFVLDLTHDPFSGPALRAYAHACARLYPKLAEDLRAKLGTPDEATDLGELGDELARLRNNLGVLRREKQEADEHHRRELCCVMGLKRDGDDLPSWNDLFGLMRVLRESAEGWFPRIAGLVGAEVTPHKVYLEETWRNVHNKLSRTLDHLKARLFDAMEQGHGS